MLDLLDRFSESKRLIGIMTENDFHRVSQVNPSSNKVGKKPNVKETPNDQALSLSDLIQQFAFLSMKTMNDLSCQNHELKRVDICQNKRRISVTNLAKNNF